MSYLVLLMRDDPDLSDTLLDAWEAAGVGGVTILESSGIGRVRRASLRDDMPLLPSLRDLLRGDEEHHRTFLTGLLFAMPLSHVYGLQKDLPAAKPRR